jgi:hypothetical protein
MTLVVVPYAYSECVDSMRQLQMNMTYYMEKYLCFTLGLHV